MMFSAHCRIVIPNTQYNIFSLYLPLICERESDIQSLVNILWFIFIGPVHC